VKRHYLDHASTTLLRPRARELMGELLAAMAAGELGDPARVHAEGMRARNLLEDARSSVAAWLGVRPRQVVFTSGATESIAMANHGACTRGARDGRDQVVLGAVEHSAVRQQAQLSPVTSVGVDRHGRVDPEEFIASVGDRTAVAHLQWANHEVATLQDVEIVAAALADHPCLLHVDAAQAGSDVPRAVASRADLVSVSGHKLGGPPGVGLLVIRAGLRIPPLILGGDQERARRAGMENLLAVAGLAAAVEELSIQSVAEAERMRGLTDLVAAWADRTEGVSVLGAPLRRAPHLLCLALEGVEPQPVLLGLDSRGISVHSGSSCSSEAFEPSPVLAAMGVDAQRSLRISVGWSSTEADVLAATGALEEVLGELRALGTAC